MKKMDIFKFIRFAKKIFWRFRKKCSYILNFYVVLLSGERKKSHEILDGLKGKYTGRRCFIIGNGPSLRAEDLDKLCNEVTFASNRIYNIMSETKWLPTFYAMFDEGVAASPGVAEGASSINCNAKFFREQAYSKYKTIKGNCCFVHSFYSRKYLDKPHFSEDLKKGVYTIGTVTYAIIQLAAYMGFTEIYLLGMDNRYAYSKLRDGTVVKNEGVADYFGKQGIALPAPSKAVATWEMDVAFECAKQYAVEHGIHIYNATRGGFLEIFPRVCFDEVVNKEVK